MRKHIVFLFTALTFSISSLSFAANPILSYEYGEKVHSISKYSADYFLVNRVEVFDDYSLSVSLAEVSYQNNYTQKMSQYIHIDTTYLTFFQHQMIMKLVASLSVAPLTRISRSKICEIVVDEHRMVDHLSIKRDWDYQTQTFASPLELISTPSGCWMKEEVNPRFHNDVAEANLLKIILQVIYR